MSAPEGVAREPGGPCQPRPPDRGRRARPRRGRRQPRLRTDRLDLRRRVHGARPRSVRAELNKVARGYQLTFDTTGWIGNYPIEAATAAGGADAVVIMGYDYRNGSSNPVGSVAPIGGPSYDIGNTIAAYLGRLPASKVILGVPYYGRAWSTDTSALHAKNISGTKYGASTTVVYAHGPPVRRRSRPAMGSGRGRRRGPPTAARTAPRRTAA